MTDTTTMPDSATAAPTRFIETRLETYAYRRFGGGAAPPLVFLQHFTGTLDNWDPAVTDPLARSREVILFESAGLGRSTGEVPTTIAGMTAHFLAFADALGLTAGRPARLLARRHGGAAGRARAARRSSARCCWSAPRPRAARTSCTWRSRSSGRILEDPNLSGYQVLVKLFFTPSEASQAAGQEFVTRLAARTEDREPRLGPEGRAGPGRRVSRVGAGRWRAFREAAGGSPSRASW